MSYTIIKDPAIEPFHISKDQYCYTVYETVTPDKDNLEVGSKGKDYQKPLGHYGNFGSALKAIAKAQIDLKGGEYNSIQSYLEEWNVQQEIIDKLFSKISV